MQLEMSRVGMGSILRCLEVFKKKSAWVGVFEV